MEVLLRSVYGATAVMAVPLRFPLRIGQACCGIAEVLNMFKVSTVPPPRSAVLTVFRGATAINDGTTPEPRQSLRCHCGLCRTSTAVAPRLRCDGGSSNVLGSGENGNTTENHIPYLAAARTSWSRPGPAVLPPTPQPCRQ